ncbi:MAG TPA: hypothetical protein VGK20_00265 [Candidatus Binatia bacterium]|jgi:hypothetical protein
MLRLRSTLWATAAAAALVAACVPAAQAQVTICRGPGFYQNHGGSEKDGENVVQDILSAVDGINVCGHHITETTFLGGLDSALEGLCVRTQGVDQRQLYRELITADLNCQVSEGGSCDEISGRFIDINYSDCDALCSGETVDGLTQDTCIAALACFNEGGRYIEGTCYSGTCNDDGVTLCNDTLVCANNADCVQFDDSCAGNQFCSQDLQSNAQICPKHGPASSPMECRVARKDGCTIDDIACYNTCTAFDTCVAACDATPGCDPNNVCDSEGQCFDYCLFEGFGDHSPCGCELSWAEYCDAFAAQFYPTFDDCLADYPTAEANGFCEECGADPGSCIP